jgi:acyl carrier protein phosphodiesterase
LNFLAHIYLSGNNDRVKVGNFIGDWIKGKQYQKYHIDIQKGVLLHRQIDSFTDKHQIVKETRQLFYSCSGRYSGIVLDVVFDHFLSFNWHKYSNIPLNHFIDNTHLLLMNYSQLFPFRIRRIFPSLIYNNWIRQYISFYGLEKVLTRMSMRTSLPNVSVDTIVILKNNYEYINHNFQLFFDELIDYCEREINQYNR